MNNANNKEAGVMVLDTSRPKIFLRKLSEICTTFGVGKKRVRTWVSMGAPIVIEGQGYKKRYSVLFEDLHEWRKSVFK